MNTSDTAFEQLRAAAARHSPQAWFELAQALVAQHAMAEASAWHRRAAEADFAPAQIELARMQMYGVGVSVDPRQAVQWLLRAEASGYSSAAYLLAVIAVGEVALPLDGQLNARVHTVANTGFPPALRAAAIHFGRKANPADQQRCMHLLELAASRGDAVSALLLAERLARGEGCRPDAKQANHLLEQLAHKGVAPLPALSVAMTPQCSGAANTLTLEDVRQAPVRTQLSERPRVAIVDGLLSADECRLLIASARPALHPSRTIDPGTGEALLQQVRTSSDAGFDPVMEDLSLRLVQQRMATAAGMRLVQAEHLVVLRYKKGQEYHPHRDYRVPESLRNDKPQAGNRARTICVYLNRPEAGGETVFLVPGIKVDPRPGRAVIFDNLLEDGRPDADSLHAGLPVQRGEKWLATLWLRQEQYRVY